MASGPAAAARPTDTDAYGATYASAHGTTYTDPHGTRDARSYGSRDARAHGSRDPRAHGSRDARAYGTGEVPSYVAVPASGGEPVVSAASLATPHARWRLKDSGSTARFRGLAAVSRTTAWVAGTAGTVLRTHDGGKHWRDISPPGAGELEFRDIEALDARRAVVLAIGEGEASRVFRTDDAGATWTESFRNTDPRAFYDCLTFFD
ncbi:WD40/YVTN/BNR-like repeat-containing protein, partial [Streptomyces decoyicus]